MTTDSTDQTVYHESSSGLESAEGERITLYFDKTRCIHSRNCVVLAPEVFCSNVSGAEWMKPDNMDEMALIAVVQRCPSGALSYQRKHGKNEQNPATNTIKTFENGPNSFHAELYINGKPVGKRATLCRCGESKNKPFCDDSHIAAGFVASGEPASQQPQATLTEYNGKLDVEPQENGPNKVTGNLEICCSSGRVIQRTTTTWLCRCGASQNKPFCDGSHAKIGFKAPA